MAVDTFKERVAMLNFGGGQDWHTLPIPDSTSTPGSVDPGDRFHMLDLYEGGSPTTKKKRLTMLNFGDGNTWHTLFEPDSGGSIGGDFDLLDRLHFLGLFLPEDVAPPIVAPELEGRASHSTIKPFPTYTNPDRGFAYYSRRRRRKATNIIEFQDDILSNFDLGTASSGSPLPNPYTMPANSRMAVSFSVALTANQLTLDVNGRVLGTPALAADEVHRVEFLEVAQTIEPTCAVAGVLTLYVLDERFKPISVATGTFT